MSIFVRSLALASAFMLGLVPVLQASPGAAEAGAPQIARVPSIDTNALKADALKALAAAAPRDQKLSLPLIESGDVHSGRNLKMTTGTSRRLLSSRGLTWESKRRIESRIA